MMKSATLPASRVPVSDSEKLAYAPPAVAARIASSGEMRWSSKNPFTAQWMPKSGPYGMPSDPKQSGMPARRIFRNGLFAADRSPPRRRSYTSPGPLHCPMKFGWHDATKPASFVLRKTSESALDERVEQGVPRHRVDPHSGSSGSVAALVCLQAPAAHDVVDRSDPETVGHPCHGRKAAFDRRFTPPEAQMELGQCVLCQDARRPARRVDVEAPHTDEICRPFEGRRVQRTDMAIDSARDHRVFCGDPVEIVAIEESTLRPLRLVPVDPDDPSAARC